MNEINLTLGAQVHCQDEEVGKLAKIVVDPETKQVSNLVVEKGLLFKQARVCPVSLVEATDSDEIRLSSRSQDLADLPEYKEVKYERPAEGWSGSGGGGFNSAGAQFPSMGGYESAVNTIRETVHEGVPTEHVVISAKTPVKNIDGELGKVEILRVDAITRQVTGLRMREGRLFGGEIDIPGHLIESMGNGSIFLTADDEELEIQNTQ
jgi:uncharacterized protein YrrD